LIAGPYKANVGGSSPSAPIIMAARCTAAGRTAHFT
jgi:hypothetical protein